MPSLKLTDSFAKRARTEQQQERFYDTRVSGLALRVTRGGARTFVLNYRTATGVERRHRIGAFPAWSVDNARKEALRLRVEIDRGGDPAAEKRERRAAPTIAELAARYLEEYAPRKRPKPRYEDRLVLETILLPALGSRKVADLTRQDIERLHRRVTAERGPIRANRVLSLIATMLNLAVRWGMRIDNPARGVDRNREYARARYLTEEEIERLMATIADYRVIDADAGDAIELLLLTGARRNEVLTATWEQFDLDAGVWVKPAHATKTDREHRVPLSPEAVEILRRRRRPGARGRVVPLRPAELVFPGGGSPTRQTDLWRKWQRIRKRAGLEDVRVHDLRHSYASLLVGRGLSLPIVGALLGHSRPQTTARYAHLADAPLREATAIVGKIVGGRNGGGK